MTKIIVMGCGYIGTNIANYFKKNNSDEFEIYVLGMKNEYVEFLDQNIKYIDIDLNELKESYSYIFNDSIVIDCIGTANATTQSNDMKFLTDINNKVKIINTLEKFNVSKYIFLSSGGTIYGDSKKKHRETDACNPLNVYALEKYVIEKYLNIGFSENHNLNYLILRLSNPYGGIVSKNKKQGIIDVTINKLLKSEQLDFFGDMDNVRDYIYIDDVSRIIKDLILSNCNNEIFNIGSGEGYSIREIFDKISDVFNKKIELVYKKGTTKNIKYNVLDITKLSTVIDTKNMIDLDKGIEKISRIIEKEKGK